MSKMDSQNRKKQSSATGGLGKSRRSFEWPLLLYPVLFLITLAILYVVNRSIEKESPRLAPASWAGPQRSVTPDPAGGERVTGGETDGRTSFAGEPGLTSETHLSQGDKARGRGDLSSSVAGRMGHAVDLNRLEGAARTAALLRVAIDEKDRDKIKQYVAELVALGDEAVAPLSKLMAEEEGDAALWAATALARIGTPLAAGALLDRLAQTRNGLYKEELCKRAASVKNHDSWPLLLDTVMQSNDTAVVRAASTALSTLADAAVLDEVMVRYDAASTESEIERLNQLVRNLRSPKATEALLSLAGNPASAPQDSLQEAAIEALGKVADAQSVSYLLRRLEASGPGQDTQIFNTITRIDNPEAQAALLYAAAGNKEVSAEHGQTAAIYALKNYPNEQTVALLERITAQEHNAKVLTAALRTLDDIKRSPQAVTANADSLRRSQQMLPLKPMEK